MKILPLFAVLVLCFTGCATTMRGPSANELASATFSEVPADIQDRIRAQFGVILRDPYSAVYQFGSPQRAYFQGPKSKLFGHVIQVTVNAKNGYGGYAGAQIYTWAWSDGQLYNATNSAKFGGIILLN